MQALAKLKKTVKRYNKNHPRCELFVINVPCMDLCPHNGVTICVPENDATRLMIVRSEDDLENIAD